MALKDHVGNFMSTWILHFYYN